MSGGSAIVLAVFLASFLEIACERIFGSWLKGPAMVILPIAGGIGLCFGFSLDFIAELMGISQSIAGTIVSGLVIGLGSDVTHGIIKKYRKL